MRVHDRLRGEGGIAILAHEPNHNSTLAHPCLHSKSKKVQGTRDELLSQVEPRSTARKRVG